MWPEVKLIAVDLDGTLLDENSRVSRRTIEAIRQPRTRASCLRPAPGDFRMMPPW